MRDQPLILIVDDNQDNRDILAARLASCDYATAVAIDGEEAIGQVAALAPDLILLDVLMPRVDGLEVCRRLRADPALPFIPIVLVTAKSAVPDVVAGLEAGADDYLTKPVEHAALVARVRSMLRIKALHDEVEAQRAELSEWNQKLQQRVTDQVAEIERVSRLRRFLSPEVAKLIVSQGKEDLLQSHRAEVTILFADLRGFTAFAEQSEPSTLMAALAAYHKLAGPLVNKHEGTVERFMGDGIMILFNDPLPCDDPTARAVRLAIELRAGFPKALAEFQTSDMALGLGMGIAHGVATMGQIGFEGRLEYSAIGSPANLAARLCSEALDGQILVSDKVARSICGIAQTSEVGQMNLKGFAQPVIVHDVVEINHTER